jgi:hypothetical protein
MFNELMTQDTRVEPLNHELELAATRQPKALRLDKRHDDLVFVPSRPAPPVPHRKAELETRFLDER